MTAEALEQNNHQEWKRKGSDIIILDLETTKNFGNDFLSFASGIQTLNWSYPQFHEEEVLKQAKTVLGNEKERIADNGSDDSWTLLLISS